MDEYQCSVADRERVLEYSLSIIVDEFLKNDSKVIDSGSVWPLQLHVSK
jgi:hypothetical protein